MATVTMDTSEYELMMKYKSQLESSLKKERELSEEIKKLNDEKIHALENARMKVVKVNTIVKREYLLRKKAPIDVFYRLKQMINSYGNYEYSEDYLKHIQDCFYETISTENSHMAYTEAVGIDEFKVELKEQLKSELDSDVKTKLENYDFYQNKVSSLLEDNKELNKTIIQLEGTVQTLEKMCSDYSKNEQSLLEEIKEHENSNTEAVEKIGKIREILHDGYGMFDKSVKLDKIISVIAVK